MRWIAAWPILLVTVGCGSDQVPTYPVSGHVRFDDGEPVRVGTIEFESQEFGTTASGQIQDDGSFVLGTYTPTDGAAAGQHHVIVVQIIINDGTFEHTKDHGRRVPRKFGDYDTSQLSVTVQAAEANDIVIELPSD